MIPTYTIVANRLEFTPRARQPMRHVNWHDDDPHCYVCGRHTDHFAEHDDLVDLGQARYSSNGDVVETDYYYTPEAAQERRVLADAWDHVIDRAINPGPITLVKPLGEVFSFRACYDKGELPSAAAWVHSYRILLARL